MAKGKKIKVFLNDDDIGFAWDEQGNKYKTQWSSDDLFVDEIDGDFKKYKRLKEYIKPEEDSEKTGKTDRTDRTDKTDEKIEVTHG